MTKASPMRLAAIPCKIKIKSDIKDRGPGTVVFYGWPMPSPDKETAQFARCRVVTEDTVMLGDPVEVPRDKVIEVKRI